MNDCVVNGRVALPLLSMKIGWRVWRSHRAQLRELKRSELGTTTEVKRVYVAAALCDIAYSVVGDPTYGAKVQPSQVAALRTEEPWLAPCFSLTGSVHSDGVIGYAIHDN